MIEQLETFHKNQKENLQLLQESYDCIYYMIGDENDFPFSYKNKNGENCGNYYEILSFFEEELSIKFQKVEYDDYQIALEKLEDNKIQLLTGMLIPKAKNPSILEDSLFVDANKVTVSDCIAENNIVLISKKNNDTIVSRNLISSYYWGADERILPIVHQTELDGHTIAYNSFEDLIQAINGDELQGLLIKESNYRFVVDNYFEDSFYNVTDISYPTEERFAYNVENTTLNGVLDGLLNIYLDAHVGAKEETAESNSLTMDVINMSTTSDQQEVDTSKRHVIGISTYVLGVAVAVLFVFSASTKIKDTAIRKNRVKELESRLSIKPDVEYEKFYIDLKEGQITSNKHFKTLLNKRKRKTMRLKELSQLTGFDYELHYKNIVFLGEEEFTEEYSLYVKGEKHYFMESGVYSNGFMVTVLTKTQ